MADLREVVTSLGHTEVATYIQSGNVVFTSKEADTMALAAALERAIAGALMALPSLRTVDPGRERLRRLSLEDCGETAPLPGPGEGLTSRRV